MKKSDFKKKTIYTTTAKIAGTDVAIRIDANDGEMPYSVNANVHTEGKELSLTIDAKTRKSNIKMEGIENMPEKSSLATSIATELTALLDEFEAEINTKK